LALEASEGLCKDHALIFEPAGRNTGPAILLSLAELERKGATRNDVVVVTPSDHVILDQVAFRQTLEKSIQLSVERESIVTIGIKPTCPHTGYGYIHRDEALDAGFKVKAFKEKPDVETAKSFVESGEFYWNAGMFVGKIGTLLGEFEKHAPEMFEYYGKLVAGEINSYNDIPADSIDYAIMEKSSQIAVVPATFDWSDLGSWDAMEDVAEAKDGQTAIHTDIVYQNESNGNVVFAPHQKVVLHGLSDYIVVSNDDVLMILPKSESQEVKNIVSALGKREETKGLI
jgi:mannose-1-phosphate guanylyltransferase